MAKSSALEPLTKTAFDNWATVTKETLNSIDDRLGAIEEKLSPLERIATSLKRSEANTAAMLSLYRRLDHRDEVFAGKLGVELRKVDAAE